jgi:hypothetical protein
MKKLLLFLSVSFLFFASNALAWTPDLIVYENKIIDQGDLFYGTRFVGMYSSIAKDSLGYDHIIYLELFNNGTKGNLKHCTNTPTSDSLDFSCEYVSKGIFNFGWTDASGTVITAGETSVAIDSNDKLHVLAYDANDTDLIYCDNIAGWSCVRMPSLGDYGVHNGIAIDTNDKVHIVFIGGTGSTLWYGNNTGPTWYFQEINASNNIHPSIRIGTDNAIQISSLYLAGPAKGPMYCRSNEGVNFQCELVADKSFLSNIGSGVVSIDLSIDNAPFVSFGTKYGGGISIYKKDGASWINIDNISISGGEWYNSIMVDYNGNWHVLFENWRDYLAEHSIGYATNNGYLYDYIFSTPCTYCGTYPNWQLTDKGIALRLGRLSSSPSWSLNASTSYYELYLGSLIYTRIFNVSGLPPPVTTTTTTSIPTIPTTATTTAPAAAPACQVISCSGISSSFPMIFMRLLCGIGNFLACNPLLLGLLIIAGYFYKLYKSRKGG